MKHPKLFFGNMVIAISMCVPLLALAGCGSMAAADDPSPTTAQRQGSDGWNTCTITMPDTRRVTCIEDVASHGLALSCDWAHADGADGKAAKAERAKERNRIASSESHRRARMARKAGEDG